MNVMTEAMKRLTAMLVNVDGKLKEMGTEPYGQERLTEAQQRQKYENLTEEDLFQMIEEHGVGSVNEFLRKFEGGE